MYEKGTTLIIKVGALGDVMRSSFIAQALKKISNNKIIWVTSNEAKSLLMNNSYIDEVVSVEDKDKFRDVVYDVVINLEEDSELCKFASELKYRVMKGFSYNNKKVAPTETAKEVFNMSYIGPRPMNDSLKKKNKKTHRQLLGEIVEVDWKMYAPFLKLTDKQIEIREKFIKDNSISPNEFIVGINTGAADTWKKALPIKKTVKLIERIYHTHKCKILLFGGPNEIERNKEILSLSKVPIIDTGCNNELSDLPSLRSVCSVVVSSDSLGLHLALALKKKVVVLIGPTSVSEIGLYGLGEKVVAKSDQVCTYSKNKDPDIMNKISLKGVMEAIENLKAPTVSLIITSFKEKTLGRAINSALNQKTKHKYDLIVVTPEDKDLELAKELGATPFRDPGEGKSFALNKVFKEVNSDILIFTDGDVFINEATVEEITNMLLDPNIGCVTGRPVPLEDRDTKYGYWANVLFNAAHRLRKNAFENNNFIECSGYLFAFRGGHIKSIPIDVVEDTYLPYFFSEKGYRIGYVEKAEVYVKNVDNFKDWLLQKVRTSKAHETLDKYVDTQKNKRVKSATSEARGLLEVLKEPHNLKELYWTIQLIVSRGYMWAKVKVDTRVKNKHYNDGWETSKSSK